MATAESEFEYVCSVLETVTEYCPRGRGRNRKALCPAHADDRPSLSVRLSTDLSKVWIKCQAGCSFEQVRDALGLNNRDFRSGSGRTRTKPATSAPVMPKLVRTARTSEGLGTIVQKYPYTDEIGEVLYYNIRFEPKAFRMADRSGNISGLPHDLRRVPYNLPKLIDAVRAGQEIWWVEGEKDVESLAAAGIVATTKAGGANSEFDPEWTDFFRGARVVVVRDKDKPGLESAKRVAKILVDVAESVDIVESATPQAKSDISDHLAAGYGPHQVLPVALRSVRRSRWTLVDLLGTEPEPLSWVLGSDSMPVIPEGLTLLVGAPKAGKSWFNLNLMAAMATGRPDAVFGRELGIGRIDPVPSLYLALEDPHRRLYSRMNKVIHGIASQTELLGDVWLSLPPIDKGGREEIERWLDRNPGARAVMVDVLAKVRGSGSEQGTMYQADYDSISILKDIADDYGVGMIVTHHDRKKADDDDFLNMVSGTKGLTGAADTILYLQRKRGQAKGTLKCESRDVEECIYEIEFQNQYGRWLMRRMQDEEETSYSGNGHSKTPLVDLLKRQLISRNYCTADELAKAIDTGVDSVRRELARAREDGAIQRTKDGKWFIADSRPKLVEEE